MTGSAEIMGRRVRREVDEGHARWTGKFGFDVCSPGGAVLGRLELRIGYDDVSVFYGDRNLGVIERDNMHRWVKRPRDPLRIDDVMFALRGRTLMLALDAAPPFAVPPKEAAQILSVV
jgi:hypothetical protein